MITKFNLFEARFSDEMKIISKDSKLADILKDQKQKEFEVEREFQKYFTLNKKMRFHVVWNSPITHNIYEKIKNRKISIKSITELNNKIEKILYEIPQLIEDHEIYITGKYGIILTQSNFCVIIYIDLDKYLNKEYEIIIKTIMPMSSLSDIIREINLDI